MLTVIIGAGASYDSDPSYPPGQSDDENARLPLADQLFADRPIFSTALKRFPLGHAIIPYLRNRANNISVEQVLENLQEESQARPLLHKQLAAVRFYLHLTLWECERRWKEVTKHITSNYPGSGAIQLCKVVGRLSGCGDSRIRCPERKLTKR